MVDRVVVAQDMRSRIAQSTEQALDIADGLVGILYADTNEIKMMSQRYVSLDNPDIEIPELEPRLFSFNSPQGACPICTGIGYRLEVDPDLSI